MTQYPAHDFVNASTASALTPFGAAASGLFDLR